MKPITANDISRLQQNYDLGQAYRKRQMPKESIYEPTKQLSIRDAILNAPTKEAIQKLLLHGITLKGASASTRRRWNRAAKRRTAELKETPKKRKKGPKQATKAINST